MPRVNLSINHVLVGEVEVPQESSQCNVLKMAYEIGLIPEPPDMRFNTKYDTFAVYVINGIGDKDEPWWMFTVNGEYPDAGCSHIPVNNGDEVDWYFLYEKDRRSP